MAEKRRFLDVWILESNTVYREVPFSVVTDWVQQGRLLADDKLRPAGTNQWVRLGDTPAFAAYLPKAEPFRAEDRAEALEPVQVELTVRHRPGDEDEDVDMIPLIDISLVLLIFFMMTATVGGAGSIFDTPKATYKLLNGQPDLPWIGMRQGEGGRIEYSMGAGEAGPGTNYDSREALLKGFEDFLGQQGQPVDVNIKADQHLPFDAVSDMTVDLMKFKRARKINNIFGGVSEREGQ
jgi:biopolymer transport protein ExbD